jgi:DUF1680 family protein
MGVDVAQEFSLRLRVPGWASSFVLKLNENPIRPSVSNGYAEIRREWKNGDVVELALPLEVQQLEANPQVTQNRGKVALRRGPLVYCLEQVDQERDLDDIALPARSRLESRFEPGLLNGVAVITGDGVLMQHPAWADQLYRPMVSSQPSPVTLKAIPYYAWANRKQGKMTVWIQSAR